MQADRGEADPPQPADVFAEADEPSEDINFSLIDLDATPKMNPEESLVHLIKGNIGAGLLSLPYAFLRGGLLSCFTLLWVIGAFSIYCMHLLIRIYRHFRPRLARLKLDYGDVVRFTMESLPATRPYSKHGKFLIDTFIISSQLGFCCVYFVFVPVHIHELLLPYCDVSIYVLILLMFVLLCPLISIRSLKYLAPISLVANILVLASLAIVFQFIVRDHLPAASLPMFAMSFQDLIFFSSTVVYSFEGIGFVLPMLQRSDNIPLFTHFFGVLNTSMFLCAILFFTMGFFGLLRFGTAVKSSIALNLPQNDPLYTCTKAMFAIAVFFSYPLQFYLPCVILWPRIRRRCLHQLKEETKFVLEIVWKISLMGCTALFAAVVPNIGLMISLNGALCCTCLAIVFPPILDLMAFGPTRELGRFYHRLFLDVIILFFGLAVFAYGTLTSLRQIVRCMGDSSLRECNA